MTTRRISLADALAWIDAHAGPLGTEAVEVGRSAGRVLATPWLCGRDWPAADVAAIDGYALRAADSEGASDYNPLTLASGSAVAVTAGAPLPPDADAVLPQEAAQLVGSDNLEVLSPVARGAGVDRRGSQLRAGTPAVAAGRRLRPQDLALLAGDGPAEVRRQPRVHLIVPGAKAGAADALTPMLHALVARDGGLAHAAAASTADLVIVAGRSGFGTDDDAAGLIAAAGGTLDVHGIAFRPGETSGLGTIGGVPLLLLPGAPLACFIAYRTLGAAAMQRMAGLPARSRRGVDLPLARKIVSAIGFTDFVRVRVTDGLATPLGTAEAGGLFSVVQADGIVAVPETSEGFAPGAIVRVEWLDDERGIHE